MKNKKQKIHQMFLNRFKEFNLNIETELDDPSIPENEDLMRWATFYFSNIQEYVLKSREINKIIKNELIDYEGGWGCGGGLKKSLFGHISDIEFLPDTFTTYFHLDNLNVGEIKDSFYDYTTWKGCSAFPFHSHKEIVPVRRKDFLVNDKTGKLFCFKELSRNCNDKLWTKIIYSQIDDRISLDLGPLYRKEHETDINLCEILDLKNSSLENRLNKKLEDSIK